MVYLRYNMCSFVITFLVKPYDPSSLVMEASKKAAYLGNYYYGQAIPPYRSENKPNQQENEIAGGEQFSVPVERNKV